MDLKFLRKPVKLNFLRKPVKLSFSKGIVKIMVEVGKEELKKMNEETVFCKVSSNNQLTVPKQIRKSFGIDENKNSALLEVKFIRVVKPSEQKEVVDKNG